MRTTFAILALFGFCVLWPIDAGTATPRAKEPPPKAVEPIPFPDGVLDAERQTAFVSSPKGGIQAIRLKDGEVLWTNDDCQAQPWLVAGNRLIARGDRVFVLDLKNKGKLERKCDEIAYPKVVVPDRCTVAFHLWNPHVIGDMLEANWFGVAYIDRSKGRPFNHQGWTGFNKEAPAGGAVINLANGKVIIANDKPIDVTAGLIPAASKPESRIPANLSKEMIEIWQRYQKDSDKSGRVTVLGNRLVGVSMTLLKRGNEYDKKIDLNAWDIKTGKAAMPIELAKDSAQKIANIALTQDHRHAAIQFSNSAVNIYSLADGKVLGKELQGVRSLDSAFVEGSLIFFTETKGFGKMQTPQILRALDIGTGKVAWERDIKPRDTRPLPP
jgi:hypothetical protein